MGECKDNGKRKWKLLQYIGVIYWEKGNYYVRCRVQEFREFRGLGSRGLGIYGFGGFGGLGGFRVLGV